MVFRATRKQMLWYLQQQENSCFVAHLGQCNVKSIENISSRNDNNGAPT